MFDCILLGICDLLLIQYGLLSCRLFSAVQIVHRFFNKVLIQALERDFSIIYRKTSISDEMIRRMHTVRVHQLVDFDILGIGMGLEIVTSKVSNGESISTVRVLGVMSPISS